MRIAYGDLIGGISGDMFVAALLDLGLPLDSLKLELKKLPTLRYTLKVTKKSLHAIRATRFRVISARKEPERSWKQIRGLIRQSTLNAEIKEKGLAVFARLAEAEGKIHRVAADNVRFHEVGATDSIVDIMAAAIGVHLLKIDSLHFSPVPLGRGVTRSRHGPLPVPGPATLEILKGLPVRWIDVEGETVTPTGAAILSTLGAGVGEAPEMTVEEIGYGAGEREFPDRPNVVRLVLGRDEKALGRDEMLVIETNIDDMNPEFYDYVLDRLFETGARDVFLSSIQMKKNRPGTRLSVIAEPGDKDRIMEILFRETSTIGIRYYPVKRMILKRETSSLKTRFGTVKVKMIEQPDGTKRAAPEYDDLRRIAQAKKIPLKVVYEEVLRQL